MTKPLFQEIGDSDSDISPARHGEPHWMFLNRSSTPLAVDARRRLEEWFADMCTEMQESVRARLASDDDEAFSAAYWELLLHEFLIRQGYSVTCEPELPNGKRIDFLVQHEDGDSFYLEATIARRSASEQAADARRHRIYEHVNANVRSRHFMLSVQVESADRHDLPNLTVLASRLQSWLEDLDPDASVATYNATGELPAVEWTDGGWHLIFEALAVKPEARDDEPRSILGMFMDETGGAINDEAPLRNALRGKRPALYGELDHPYVIAVCEFPFGLGHEQWHRLNALFGHVRVRFADGAEPEWVRGGDGFWRSGSGRPLNTRVAAVLLAAHATPWTVDQLRLQWWPHPFATRPVPASAIPRGVAISRLAVTNGDGEIEVTEPHETPAALLEC